VVFRPALAALAIADVIFVCSLPSRCNTSWIPNDTAVLGDLNAMKNNGGGGDCGYPFVHGVSYLVCDGQQNGDGRLHTGICSATAPAVGAGGVLPELR